MAEERGSFWNKLFDGSFLEQRDEERERKVMEYICHRVSEGAHLRDIIQEEYVRRNASQEEIEDLLNNPKQMREDFSSGRLDPKPPPSAAQ
jgi:hypothetical protein